MIVYTVPKNVEKDLTEQIEKANLQALRVEHASWFDQYPDADLYIDGCFEGYFSGVKGPYLFHSPANCLTDYANLPANIARFCAWPGFWERSLWEIAMQEHSNDSFSPILQTIGIQARIVPDSPGFIAPRILSTLINEAAYTMADRVANASDIDTAMELGTNYPLGPVKWGRKIGLKNVQLLLQRLALEDKRYLPHPDFESILTSKS